MKTNQSNDICRLNVPNVFSREICSSTVMYSQNELPNTECNNDKC